MQIQFFSAHYTLNDAEHDYLEKKISHLSHLADELNDPSCMARVDVVQNMTHHHGLPFTVQVTISLPHAFIRGEKDAVTLQAACDLAIEQLHHQIERYASKLHRRGTRGEWIPESTLEQLSSAQTEEVVPQALKISKRKRLDDIRPLHEEEAIEQMELLGHDFFVYENLDTKMLTILYARKEGEGYGVIECPFQTLKQW